MSDVSLDAALAAVRSVVERYGDKQERDMMRIASLRIAELERELRGQRGRAETLQTNIDALAKQYAAAMAVVQAVAGAEVISVARGKWALVWDDAGGAPAQRGAARALAASQEGQGQ